MIAAARAARKPVRAQAAIRGTPYFGKKWQFLWNGPKPDELGQCVC